LDSDFVEKILKARDEIFSIQNKIALFSSLVFFYLISNYYSIDLKVDFGFFSLENKPGSKEFLLLLANLAGFYSSIIGNNKYKLESVLHYYIEKTVDKNLQEIYLSMYFPLQLFGRYNPINLPNLIYSDLLLAVDVIFLIIFVLASVSAFLFVVTFNFIFVYDLWVNLSVGFLSKISVFSILVLSISSICFVIMTRFKMPYRDYQLNIDLENAKKESEEKYREMLLDKYSTLSDCETQMRERGYL
jgi:ABC-type multidrug transport system fused ATPase/permease subunit